MFGSFCLQQTSTQDGCWILKFCSNVHQYARQGLKLNCAFVRDSCSVLWSSLRRPSMVNTWGLGSWKVGVECLLLPRASAGVPMGQTSDQDPLLRVLSKNKICICTQLFCNATEKNTSAVIEDRLNFNQTWVIKPRYPRHAWGRTQQLTLGMICES